MGWPALKELLTSGGDTVPHDGGGETVLDYMQQLQAVNTDGVEPLAHPLPVQNIFRDDEPVPSLPVDEALANAPRRIGDFYGVPAVLD